MTPRLHVAVITETFPPEVNGVAMTLGRMVEGLLAAGHRVSLTRPRQRADAADPPCGIPTSLVGGLPMPGYPGLRFGLPARGHLRRRWSADRPDVVQVVTEGPLGTSAVRAARDLRIPVVTEFHTNFHAYSRHYGFGWLERLVARHLRTLHNRGDLTLVPTHEIAERLEQAGYRNVRVVARGVDTTLFHPGRRSRELRASWGAGDEDLVIAHVGRLAPEKNLPLVFSTFAAIRRHAPRARLVMVGDGPVRNALQRRHADAIFAGMRRGEDLAAHYASADLFLFPSLTETYGNVVLEALASGLPVVAFRQAAAAELIRHGRNGMLAAPGAGDEFERAALDIVVRPDLRRRAALEAPAGVALLDWGRINDRLVAYLREAINRSARRSRADSIFRFVPD